MTKDDTAPALMAAAEPVATMPETEAATTPALKPFIEVAREILGPFLKANPGSKIGELVQPAKQIAIINPWGDPSLVLFVTSEITPLAEALNNLYLPPRLTAVWHKDTQDIEVIWTAYKLPAAVNDVFGRSFVFEHEGQEYVCEFGRSSDRLLTVAKAMRQVSGSDTSHRNLQSFNWYAGESKALFAASLGEPVSFWIRKVAWSEDDVLDMINHLNFYMQYFDYDTPHVLIHQPKTDGPLAPPRSRHIHEAFPKRIVGKPLDDNLLHFWSASREGDQARRFIYAYRIIEYASSLYIDMAARSAVRKLLAAPNVLDNIVDLTDRVVGAISKSKLEDLQKCEHLLRDTVDSNLLWREISGNSTAFSSETLFDGGYKVPALIAVNSRKEDFAVNGIQNFARSIRDIRNALSHGRDQKTTAVITPTAANFRRLLPWVNLISVAAGEVILYQNVI